MTARTQTSSKAWSRMVLFVGLLLAGMMAANPASRLDHLHR